MHPKLAKPTSQLRPSYQVVVIGSGYGGSIAASRLARAGQRVCLLEKGREIRPGEFPDRFAQAAPQMQMHTPKGRLGDDTGLYEVVMGQGISVVKGCGLGGTSLINANVSIEPEPRVFERTAWPTAIRQDLASVYEGMAKARAMLKPTPYPAGQPNYPVLPKTLAHQQSAAALGEKFAYLDINVNFADQTDGNHVGVAQQACNNCGDCCSGCNVSAKNTLPMNYLPDAVNHGAEIFCEVGVSHLERRGDKWLVFYQLLNVDREKFEAPLLFVEADLVFLGAGALGSTEILLRSEQRGGLDLSPMLGAQFTGNGDVLGFGYNNDQKINGVGFGDRTDVDPVGPCITSVIDARHKPMLEEGMVIEEGSIPGAVKPLLKPMLFTASRVQQGDTDEGWADWAAEKAREAETLVRGVYHGAISHTQTYLIMTHDDHSGRLSLDDNGRLALDWPGVGKQRIFAKANQNLQTATKALGGSFVHNPVWTEQLDFDLVTVHPLGGCIMADRAEAGVTDHKGQVFRGRSGTGVYPGLFVVDGAIIPCSLGTNPLLTISGLAERNIKLVAEAHGWQVSYDLPPRRATDAPPLNAGVMFTETMKGFFAMGETADYQAGLAKGKADNSPLAFTLTIQVDDVDAFVDDPAHLAGMAGTVVAPHLSTKALTVSGGQFNLFVKDPAKPNQKYMEYQFQLHSVEGRTYFFNGFKDVRDDPGFDVWKDLTVLYVTLHDGPDAHAPVLGKGMLKIEVGDFATQLTTMKPLHTKGLRQKTAALLAFGRLFGGDVLDTYF